ncbi:MAG: hypothetical protein WC679_01335 [Bacteroidales bacterium]|jgi:hypothetical protein
MIDKLKLKICEFLIIIVLKLNHNKLNFNYLLEQRQKFHGRYQTKQDLCLSDNFGSVTLLKQGSIVTIISCEKNKVIFETMPWSDKNIRYMDVNGFNNSFEKI